MKYKIINDKILLSLQKGDEIFTSINTVIKKENLKFCWLSGIGAFENILLGSYSIEKKGYIKKKFKGEYELTSLVGNVTIKDGKPFIHIHINMSDVECKAYGGHLFSATITATCEMILFKGDKNVFRTMNENIGLYLWDLNCGK